MTSPGARQALLVGQVLEDVLLHMGQLRRKIDRSHPVAKIEAALEALQKLADSEATEPEHLELFDAALAATREARIAFEDNDPTPEGEPLTKRLFGAQRALEHVRAGTIDAVVAVQDQSIKSTRRGAVTSAPFRASLGSPKLQRLSRVPLASGVDVVAPDEWVFDDVETGRREAKLGEGVESDEELDLLDDDGGGKVEDFVGAVDEEPDGAKRLQLLVPIGDDPVMASGIEGEVAQLERVAKQCFEDIGVMGNLRRVDAKKLFVADAVARFEQRLLSNVDAALALGTPFEIGNSVGGRFSEWAVLEHAIAWAKDTAVPDPTRAFARTYLLCSVDGRDAVRAAVLSLKQSHPATYEMHAEAFALAPNPGIDAAMVELCSDDDPRIIAMAANVLAMRGRGDAAPFSLLLAHTYDPIRIAAARCAATASSEPTRQAAIQSVSASVEEEIDDEVALAEIEALIRLRSADGLRLARDRIQEDAEEPGALQRSTCDRLLQLVAIAGNAGDTKLLCASYRGEPGAAVALGRHGHIDAIPVLIDILRSVPGLTLVGEKGKLAAAEALARITGAIVQPTVDQGLDPIPLPVDPGFWESWWEEHGGRFDEKVRYRFGQPYTPLLSLAELELPEVIARDRDLCALELAILPDTPTIRVTDFLALQRAAIDETRRRVEADLASDEPRQPPGAWAGSHLT